MSEKAAAKVLDEKDEAFCAHCSLQVLDQDGIPVKTKGNSVQAPLVLTSPVGADTLVMEACFEASNPLFFLEIRQEEQFYLWGQVWMDGPKYSEASHFCTLSPIRTQDVHRDMEKRSSTSFEAKANCPYLRNNTSKMLKVTCETEEKRFKTKLTKVIFSVPKDDWMEYKQYRVRLWKAGKNWAGAGDDKDKDKDKKDGEKEEGDGDKMED